MRLLKFTAHVSLLTLVAASLVGCTVTVVQPTPTVAPTATPRPTFTPAVLPTAVPSATATPEPSATPTSTRTPTRTPIPEPVGTPAPPPVLGRLQIPKLTVDAKILPLPIIDGDWDTKRIVMEVGWLEGTAPVGSRGNIGIAGHVSLKCCGDGPFRWLEKTVPGDQIILKTDEQTYTYQVTAVRVVSPTEISVLQATDWPQLTLVTCYDWDYGKAEFTKRFVVIAR